MEANMGFWGAVGDAVGSGLKKMKEVSDEAKVYADELSCESDEELIRIFRSSSASFAKKMGANKAFQERHGCGIGEYVKKHGGRS